MLTQRGRLTEEEMSSKLARFDKLLTAQGELLKEQMQIFFDNTKKNQEVMSQSFRADAVLQQTDLAAYYQHMQLDMEEVIVGAFKANFSAILRGGATEESIHPVMQEIAAYQDQVAQAQAAQAEQVAQDPPVMRYVACLAELLNDKIRMPYQWGLDKAVTLAMSIAWQGIVTDQEVARHENDPEKCQALEKIRLALASEWRTVVTQPLAGMERCLHVARSIQQQGAGAVVEGPLQRTLLARQGLFGGGALLELRRDAALSHSHSCPDLTRVYPGAGNA